MNDENVFKVLLLGDSTVGKTCFLMKYTDKTFQEIHMSTIGLDYRLKSMKLKNGKTVKLQIWDTAGQDRFRSITKNYYKSANGIIVIYDVTSLQTYENVKIWIEQIREEAPQNVVIYLAGNKIDLEEERKVKTEEGKKLAEEYGFPFLETSAKNDININETFENLVEDIDKIYSKNGNNNGVGIKKNKIYKGDNKKGCC
jgi:small GTP-binding protein